MKSKMYSIRDKKLAVFGRPFFASDELVAKRGVAASLQNPENQMRLFSTDYELIELGSFDDSSGKVDIYQFPMHVCEIATLIAWIEMITRKPEVPAKIEEKKQEVKNA